MQKDNGLRAPRKTYSTITIYIYEYINIAKTFQTHSAPFFQCSGKWLSRIIYMHTGKGFFFIPTSLTLSNGKCTHLRQNVLRAAKIYTRLYILQHIIHSRKGDLFQKNGHTGNALYSTSEIFYHSCNQLLRPSFLQ